MEEDDLRAKIERDGGLSVSGVWVGAHLTHLLDELIPAIVKRNAALSPPAQDPR